MSELDILMQILGVLKVIMGISWIALGIMIGKMLAGR